MGIFKDLSDALKPHSDKLNATIALERAALDGRLQRIEAAMSDLGRGDIGNKWQRFVVNGKLKAELKEIGTCPINEMWLIQAIAADGVQEKSPPCVLLASGVLIESIIKEGLGFEGVGGNQVLLPGEVLSILPREEGSYNISILIIRRPLPVIPTATQYGRDADVFGTKGTHDENRDMIAARLGPYPEQPAIVEASEGRREGTRTQ